MPIEVKVKLYGVFRRISGKSQILVKMEEPVFIKNLMHYISTSLSNEFGQVFIEKELDDSLSNMLILVNGREISVLDGLETELKDGSEIVFIPVSHGG